MRRFNEIIKEVSKLGDISKNNIDKYISLLEEAKQNLKIVKEIDMIKAKKQKNREIRDLLKRRKKYLKNEERINSLYDYYTNMESGIKNSSQKIIFEKYYLCKLLKSPNINKQYEELYSRYFVNIDDECYIKLNEAMLVPIIAQDIGDEKKDILSGKCLKDLSCEGVEIIRTIRINRNQLLDKFKALDQDYFVLYRKKMQEFYSELDMLKYQDNESESILSLHN